MWCKYPSDCKRNKGVFQTIIEILMVGQSRRNIGRYKRLLPHIRTAYKKKKNRLKRCGWLKMTATWGDRCTCHIQSGSDDDDNDVTEMYSPWVVLATHFRNWHFAWFGTTAVNTNLRSQFVRRNVGADCIIHMLTRHCAIKVILKLLF